MSSPLHFCSPDQLNTYYASISASTPPCPVSIFLEFLSGEQPESPLFSFQPILSSEISSTIISSPSRAPSSGIDLIPLFAIRISLPAISDHITKISNDSLSKLRTPLSPSDTRPIANLSEFSQIFERIIHKQIVKYITCNNILDPKQSRFRSGYSTQTALLRLSDDVRKSVDDRKVTILILFDFSKTFDTIPHLGLLNKLRNIGFSSEVLKWVYSYLSERSQVVIDLDSSQSARQPISCGVPQGSVLGPLLFSIDQ